MAKGRIFKRLPGPNEDTTVANVATVVDRVMILA